MRFALLTGGTRKRPGKRSKGAITAWPHPSRIHRQGIPSGCKGDPVFRRVRWRSDWTPVGSVVLLVALLIALSLFLPTNKAVERVKQAAQADKTDQLPPVVGVLAEP
jgi:hypothetical protein